MSMVNSDGIAVHLDSPSQSRVHEHESSNLLRPAFQKAIERAADKQAAAERATLNEVGVNEAACHSVLECEAITTPAGDLIVVQTSASSALAQLNGDVSQDDVPDTKSVAQLSTCSSGSSTSHTDKAAQCTDVSSLPQMLLTDPAMLESPLDHSVKSAESAQDNGISSASQWLDTGDSRSIDDVQGVVTSDGENQPVATSEHIASAQLITSSASASPRSGFDQQAFDTLSHMLSKQNTLDDKQTDALTLKVIAGMPGVESLKVQQDQSGQWHLQLQLNPNSRRLEEQHKAELLAELSERGHTMGSVSIVHQADSHLAKQEI